MNKRSDCIWPAPVGRPPTLLPRRRDIEPLVEHRLCIWIRRALSVPAETPVELFEWVSMDSREVPHSLSAIVGGRGALGYFTIAKASECVTDVDVRAMVSRTKPVPLAVLAPNQPESCQRRAASLSAPEKR